MRNCSKYWIYLAILLSTTTSFAEQYQIFDGQVYNGLFYPNIDILEWGEPTHLEFQIYDKKNPIHISGQTVEVNGRNLFQIAIDLSFRGERRCRRIIAPATFTVGQKLHYYLDQSDKDMNNIIISAHPIPGKAAYPAQPFKGCTEQAANSGFMNSSPTDSVAQESHSQDPSATLEELKDVIVVDLNAPETLEPRPPSTPQSTPQRQIAAATPSPSVAIHSELNDTHQTSPESSIPPSTVKPPTPPTDDPNDGSITGGDYDWFSNK